MTARVRAAPGVRGRPPLPLLAIPFPAIDPVLVAIGPFAIRWYALAYIAGIVLGWRLVRRLVQRPGWAVDARRDRRPRLLRHAGHHPGRPARLRPVLPAGLLSHPPAGHPGRLARRHVVPRRPVGCPGRDLPVRPQPRPRRSSSSSDALAVVTPIGLFLGRLANFINGELWGRATDVPWAVVFPTAGPGAAPSEPALRGGARGPASCSRRACSGSRAARTAPSSAGRLSGVFLIGYALARITVEFFREPDAQLGYLAGGLTMGQLLSLPMLAVRALPGRRARRRRVEAPAR